MCVVYCAWFSYFGFVVEVSWILLGEVGHLFWVDDHVGVDVDVPVVVFTCFPDLEFFVVWWEVWEHGLYDGFEVCSDFVGPCFDEGKCDGAHFWEPVVDGDGVDAFSWHVITPLGVIYITGRWLLLK